MTLNVDHLKRKLTELEDRLKHTPNPAYAFRPGDKVRVGSLQNAVVEEVLHDGKIYLIDYTGIDHNYGKPIRVEHQKGYFNWMQVRKLREDQNDSLIQHVDMNLRYSYRMLSDMLNKTYHFGVNFDPDYQRGNEWELADKQLLIESIFHNVDIGKFVFIQYDTKTWIKSGYGFEILDGKQRLRALLEFYEDHFAWQGLTFSDLSARDQNHFMSYPVALTDVKDLTREKTLRYFLLLNTVGKVMDQAHLDKVRTMLDELS